MLKLNASVIYLRYHENGLPFIATGTVTKIKDTGDSLTATVWLNGNHHEDMAQLACFLYPDVPLAQAHLELIVSMRKRHKEEENAAMSAGFVVNNEFIRAGLR